MIDEKVALGGTVMVFPGTEPAAAVRRELRDAGLRLLEPADSLAAVAQLPNDAIDLVLVEPASVGHAEAVVAAVGSRSHPPLIVVLGGYDMGPLQARDLFSLGASDVIMPPHHPTLVMAKIAALVRLKRRLDETRELSVRDELTGLYNRRFFYERLEQEIARAVRNNLGLGLILFDADLFKSVNDTYGHPVGDRLLAGIAATIEASVRKSDILARMGGDEFALLLTGNSLAGARVCAELMRKRLANARLDLPAAVRVTCSWGIAAYPNPLVRHPMQDLVKEADLALLRAKAQGRDRVVASGE